MAQFYRVMQEHLRKIKTKEPNDTYLSKHIQNELISIVAKSTTDAIVEREKNCCVPCLISWVSLSQCCYLSVTLTK